jgi:hypothetical protein
MYEFVDYMQTMWDGWSTSKKAEVIAIHHFLILELSERPIHWVPDSLSLTVEPDCEDGIPFIACLTFNLACPKVRSNI